MILPQAFISAAKGDNQREIRQTCIESLTKYGALDFMIETIKEVSLKLGNTANNKLNGGTN